MRRCIPSLMVGPSVESFDLCVYLGVCVESKETTKGSLVEASLKEGHERTLLI